MTFPRPRIVVSLPARSAREAVEQLRSAAAGGADAAEVRYDRWPVDERSGLAQLFPSPLPLLATYRSRAEGGEGEAEPERRRPVLLALATHPFRWIDLEFARDLPLLPELPPSDRLGRIVSVHLADGESREWADRSRALESVDGVGKLVVRASVGEALGQLVPEAARRGAEMVIHTTGPSGPLFRAWARRFGFPLVYAALPSAGTAPPVEPSQIPVDQLLPFLEAEAAPLFAVCGRPVTHSKSPAIQARWLRDDRRGALYVALEFSSEPEFLDALGPLAEGGFRGLNVTAPFKQVAAEAATELGAGAVACGAANCLTFRGESIVGENTDLLAVLHRLEELRRAGRWEGEELAVIGAGGAARATLAAANELRATATVFARRKAAAHAVAERFGATDGQPAHARPFPLVVHATDAGRRAEDRLEVPLAPLLGPDTFVLDWVYEPVGPVVRDAAARAGATYEDGRRLLVAQAAASYEIWWGRPPSPEAVRRAVEAFP